MRLNEVDFGTGVPIDGYGPGFFRVGGEVFEGPVLVLPGGVVSWTGFADWSAVVAAKESIDFLFIGMGNEVAHLTHEDRTLLEAEGIAAEPMASPAAARTYNVLLSEGRRVGAALLPVSPAAPATE